jgi:hypothetical protein
MRTVQLVNVCANATVRAMSGQTTEKRGPLELVTNTTRHEAGRHFMQPPSYLYSAPNLEVQKDDVQCG